MLLVLLLLQQARPVAAHMLVPGIRLIERPDALHLFDGRRVVSITGDDRGREAILAAARDGGIENSAPSDDALADARRVLGDLRLLADPDATTQPAPGRPRPAEDISAAYVSAATAGWVPAGRAERRLHEATVHVLGPATVPTAGPAGPTSAGSPTEALVAALVSAGIRITKLDGPNGVAQLDPARDVVAVIGADDDPVGRLVAANAACVRAKVPLLPIGGYDGARIHVGPLVIPHQSACLDCMLRRAAANVTYTDLFDLVVAAPVAPTPGPLRQWAASIAALVLLRWIGDADVRMPGRLFTLVPDDLQIRQSIVHRVPRCRVCSAPDFEPRAAPWEPARDH